VGLTHREIAQSCGVSTSTVSEYTTHDKAAGLSWPLPEGMSAKQLEARLFPAKGSCGRRQIPQPDWKYIHKELRRKSVTLSLLWVELSSGTPQWLWIQPILSPLPTVETAAQPQMHQKHKAGEKLFVEYAGQTVPVVDLQTGKTREAQVFVATLGTSNYTYAEAHWSQSLPNWIAAHMRVLAFLGGVPEIIVPDNPKAGVSRPDRYEPDLNPTYQDFARHYSLAVVQARVRKPQDKAKVEGGVQVVEYWILARLRSQTFFSLAELNQAIAQLLVELNQREMKHLGQSRWELFVEVDQPVLARKLLIELWRYLERALCPKKRSAIPREGLEASKLTWICSPLSGWCELPVYAPGFREISFR
jgi:transposase